MQYMLMFYENDAEVAAQRDTPERTGPYWDAWNAYMGALYPTGIVVRGDALLPPSAATTVRLEGGNRLVQDGPVAATKEQLAGYVVIEVPDLDAAPPQSQVSLDDARAGLARRSHMTQVVAGAVGDDERRRPLRRPGPGEGPGRRGGHRRPVYVWPARPSDDGRHGARAGRWPYRRPRRRRSGSP